MTRCYVNKIHFLQGLKVGDKILEVNGHSFYGMTHAEAVTIMRNAWNLIMYLESPTNSENTPGWHGGMVFTELL